MDIEWAPAHERSAQRVWAQVLRPVAVQMRDAAPQLAIIVNDAIRADLPLVFADADTVEENRVSAEASIRLLAQALEQATDPAKVELPPATIAFARTEVQRRVASSMIGRAYRAAFEVLWQWMLARIAEHCRDQGQLLRAAELGSGWLFAFLAASIDAAEAVFEAEEARWLRSIDAARAEAIDDIAAGRESDARRAETRLRYKLSRHHVAAYAWTDSGTETDPQTVLETELSRLAQRLGAETTLLHTTGLQSAVMWLSRTHDFDVPADIPLRSSSTDADIRIALGEPGSGLSGFRRSFHEAGHARRVAMLSASRDPIVRYGAVAVAAMATVDTEQATAFVQRVLGPLAAPDENTRRLADTLAAYLAENGSRSRAGERLGVHGNTVRYRVLQAEQLLGRSVDGDTLDVRVALEILPSVRGSGVIRPTVTS